VTDTGRMVLVHHGETVCDIPLGPLADDAPLYDRPHVPTPQPEPLTDLPECTDPAADLLKLMGSPDLASRRWIWEQYDHMVGADTVQRPGGDAAVVRVHGTEKGLAISTDCTPRYCFADPVEGGKQAIAECWRNITAVGATPLATTDCMNFANPQRPEIMGQFVGCIEGMAEACTVLDFPIVSGNVSLYNESKATGGGSAILPTPAIGGVGLLPDISRMTTIGFKGTGDIILLVGERRGDLGQSLWLRELHGREGRDAGPPPRVDLAVEKRTGDFIREAIRCGALTAVHDVSDGGVAVAVAEMALASGIGAIVDAPISGTVAGALFAEDQGLYVVTARDAALMDVLVHAEEAGVSVERLGRTIANRIIFELSSSDHALSLDDLRAAHEGFFPTLMAGEV
jgi:phosphoribosylformylglycinamidine synthase II